MIKLRLTLLSAALATACGADAPGAESTAESQASVLAEVRRFLDEKTPLADLYESGIDRRLADLAVTDSEGVSRRLSELVEGSALVVAVRHASDPDLERTRSRLLRLRERFDAGVRYLYLGVSDGGEFAPEQVAADLAGPGEALFALDPDGSFARALGVEASSASFVIDRSRTLRYRGAIDDQVGRGGVVLDAPRKHFLEEALSAVLRDEQVLVRATLAPGLPLELTRTEPDDGGPPTYHGRIARLLQTHCISCHHDKGAGPFPLDSYEATYDRRRMIQLVVDGELMPPWYTLPGSVPFENDPRLPDGDREALLAWIEAGAPEGDRAETPVTLQWPESWNIGEPDAIYQLVEAKRLPAEGAIEWDPIPGDRVTDRDMWVQAVEVLPTDRAVVHHATVFFKPPESYAERAPGSKSNWQRLIGYVPGKGPMRFQPGLASFVPAGSELLFQMHYTTQGRATVDRTQVGIVAADEPPRFMPAAMQARKASFRIPPESKVQFTTRLEVPRDTALVSIGPHMHLRGHRVDVDVIHPDGNRQGLLRTLWHPDWEFRYTLQDELILPRGAVLEVTATFDNTSANPINPDPSAWVYEGPQSWDEMMHVAFGTIQPRQDPVVFRGGWDEVPTMGDAAFARDALRAANEGRGAGRPEGRD